MRVRARDFIVFPCTYSWQTSETPSVLHLYRVYDYIMYGIGLHQRKRVGGGGGFIVLLEGHQGCGRVDLSP